MNRKKLSYLLKDTILAEDIYSNTGTLLLEKGTRLRGTDITLLFNHDVDSIMVDDDAKHIKREVIEQIRDITGTTNKSFGNSYVNNLDQIKRMFEEIEENRPISLHSYLASYSSLLESALENTSMLLALHKVRGFDDYTYRHSLNVSLLCGVIARLLHLSPDDIWLYGQCGLLHDIGKLKLNPILIQKDHKKLTDKEKEELRSHTTYGCEILSLVSGTNDIIKEAALYHHEYLDGSGYPKGLQGDQIPFTAQVVAVANEYDRYCSDQVGSPHVSPYQAAQELTNAAFNNQLNPRIVLPFVRFIVGGYIGHNVTLNDQTRGTIVYLNPDEPLRPLVKTETGYIDLRQARKLSIIEID
ncbi:putative nucleotidyltransferase with HDIG domain [Aneurinibacillus soli]|uniref:Cyclic di-GMP phosphodiesterase response regulator RpfG n=1 Tax=Aneurinibacillus soli TaxID=1500254 RepID=A0A0U5B0H0_9BACL|nr:HD domain-containing phosphohydrolase [Aneurinibacillus soli]PYE58490.1 putative nucleotidyltransferase with HDIG domain [Aneurinibacillus soli]BAU29466.1 Cyclic di-GMP phosphodiesterase response regulator RpfG [Aneurinibacillus soli]